MNVIGVQVLYKPDEELLQKALKSIIKQVDLLIIINNTPDVYSPLSLYDNNISKKIVYYPLGENVGIAKAQNIGIQEALIYMPQYIAFFDQDSIPDDSMIKTLIRDFELLKMKMLSPAIIGPSIVNRQTSSEYAGLIKKGIEICDNIVEVVDVISSGSIIPIEIIKKIGLMDSVLFIDGVDHEWCWRARKYGFKCFFSRNTILEHQVGSRSVSFFGIPINICTPFRLYYIFRNYVILCSRSYVPKYWKISHLFKNIIYFVYYPLCKKNRLSYLFSMIKGVYYGLKYLISKQ